MRSSQSSSSGRNSPDKDIQDLHQACRTRDLTIIKQALASNPAKINDRDAGVTPK